MKKGKLSLAKGKNQVLSTLKSINIKLMPLMKSNAATSTNPFFSKVSIFTGNGQSTFNFTINIPYGWLFLRV